MDNSIKTPQHYDVVIVGLGPTGAMLANLLGIQGISTLVLEREAQIYPLPRAVHFDDEIMRAFQTIGIADKLSEKVIINKGMRLCDYDGNLLLDWPREQIITDNGWYASYRFHQPDLEMLMREALRQYPHIVVKQEHLAETINDCGDCVEVSYRNRQSDELSHVVAKYVVGSDGARSTVRNAMKTEMQPLGFEQRWLVVDVILKQEMPELGDHTIQYCDPEQPATYCRNPGMRRRWEFALRDDQSDEQMTDPERIWEMLSRWITPEQAELERRAIYTFKSSVADRWQNNRLFIAGDSAHLTPPFMGQGLCAGIRDAMNLGWKLGHACKQGACEDRKHTDNVLASYETERKANAINYIQTAVRLGELINQMGQDNQPEQPIKMKSIRSELGDGLGDESNPLRGTLFPQCILESGEKLDDVVGYSAFTVRKNKVITLDNSSDDFLETLKISEANSILYADQELALAAILTKLDAEEVVVRADRYILSSDPNEAG